MEYLELSVRSTAARSDPAQRGLFNSDHIVSIERMDDGQAIIVDSLGRRHFASDYQLLMDVIDMTDKEEKTKLALLNRLAFLLICFFIGALTAPLLHLVALFLNKEFK